MTTITTTRRLLHYAGTRLAYAGVVTGHRAAQDEAGDAADALLAAAREAEEPHCTAIFRLHNRLMEAIDASHGLHPSGQEMEAIGQEIDTILADSPKT